MIFVYFMPCISFFWYDGLFLKSDFFFFLLVTFEVHVKLRLCCTGVNI